MKLADANVAKFSISLTQIIPIFGSPTFWLTKSFSVVAGFSFATKEIKRLICIEIDQVGLKNQTQVGLNNRDFSSGTDWQLQLLTHLCIYLCF